MAGSQENTLFLDELSKNVAKFHRKVASGRKCVGTLRSLVMIGVAACFVWHQDNDMERKGEV